MLGKVQGNTGNGYFSQAVTQYAKNRKPEMEKKESPAGKTIGELSDKEWDRLLEKADHSIEEYKEDLERRKKAALEQKKEQEEGCILGKGSKEQQEYEATVLWDGKARSMRFYKIDSGTEEHGTAEQLEIQDAISDEIKDEAIQKLIGRRNAPYAILADKDGMITYNGTVFQCDFEKNGLYLGDVSNPDRCLNIPLEKGGCLVVNRDNIDGLINAIGMFSPGDVKRIMQAIAEDAKLRQVELQIEDETSGAPVLEKEGEDESEK